jgi:threonine dehydrogenase-like Zn-dependent dehydrogenase
MRPCVRSSVDYFQALNFTAHPDLGSRSALNNRRQTMRALCWHGKGDVRVDTVPDPKTQHPRDAIIKITACAICGSDLHLFDGYQPTMERGDILGHENMGEVIELGSEVTNLRIGDRVVVPFTISCGQCWFCTKGLFSACERTNLNAAMAINGNRVAMDAWRATVQ